MRKIEKDSRVDPFKALSIRRHSVQTHTWTRRCCASIASLSAATSIHQCDVALSPRWLSVALLFRRPVFIAADTFVFRVFSEECKSRFKLRARPGSLPGARGRMGLLWPDGGPSALVRPTWTIVRSRYSCRRTNSTNGKPLSRFVSCSQPFSIQIG